MSNHFHAGSGNGDGDGDSDAGQGWRPRILRHCDSSLTEPFCRPFLYIITEEAFLGAACRFIIGTRMPSRGGWGIVKMSLSEICSLVAWGRASRHLTWQLHGKTWSEGEP